MTRANVFVSIMMATTLSLAEAADAQQTVTHHLRLAASPQAFFTDKDADDIIEKMNHDIITQFYPWDKPCAGVLVKREGHVFSSPKFEGFGFL
jgi:hypothetical protein